jgi:hypothetical protein
MMKAIFSIVALAFLFTAAPGSSADTTDDVLRLTKERLLPLLGKPGVIVIDARQPSAWNESKMKIKGAMRVDPRGEIGTIMADFPKDTVLVFYCS